jgi:hypothetical protein
VSTAITLVVDPATLAMVVRSGDIVSTSGTARRSSSMVGAKPRSHEPESMTSSDRNDSSTVASIEALVDDARIVTNPTRATPIIRADAVAAVRLGARRAFSRGVGTGHAGGEGLRALGQPGPPARGRG